MSRVPQALRRPSLPALVAVAAFGVAGGAAAQQSAELSVSVTVVRSCTVTEGSPDCGSTATSGTPTAAPLAQPAPRTTSRPPASAPPALESRTPAPVPPAGHTVVTIQF